MLRTVILHELRYNFLNLRFHVMMLLTVLVFGIGTIAFIKNYEKRLEEYTQTELERIKNLPNRTRQDWQ